MIVVEIKSVDIEILTEANVGVDGLEVEVEAVVEAGGEAEVEAAGEVIVVAKNPLDVIVEDGIHILPRKTRQMSKLHRPNLRIMSHQIRLLPRSSSSPK